MFLPRQMALFAAERLSSARATVRLNGRKWTVYAHRGVRFVVIRAYDKERPWVCVRVVGRTDSWDQGRCIEKEDYIVSFLRKLQRPAQGALVKPDGCDPELSKKFPALHEWLTRQLDDEGKPRQTASLTVYGVPGGFKGFLNDRGTGASLSAESDSFKGLLTALEGELESDAPQWFWRNGQGEQNGKKREKMGSGSTIGVSVQILTY